MPDQHCPTCGTARSTGCGCLPDRSRDDRSLDETAVLPHLEGPPLVRPYVPQAPDQVVDEAPPTADPFATTVLPPVQPGQQSHHGRPGPQGGPGAPPLGPDADAYATTVLPPVPGPAPDAYAAGATTVLPAVQPQPPVQPGGGDDLGYFPFGNGAPEPDSAVGGRAARRAAEQAERSPFAGRKGLIAGVGAGLLALTVGLAYAVTPSSGPTRQADPVPVTTLAPAPVDPPTLAAPTTGAPAPTTEAPSPTPTRPRPTPKPVPTLKSTVPDPQHAITVPVFDGWDAAANSAHSTVYLGSGRYTCADGNSCIRGQFSIEKDTVQGDTPKGAADAAMPAYAGTIFSGISSHTDSGSGYVSVAGVLGYATRWHVRTSDGTQGYVLLAAVPAKGGGYVVFEGGVDDDPAAPDASVLDQILKGIKQDSSSGSST